jgi:hypothetical protein
MDLKQIICLSLSDRVKSLSFENNIAVHRDEADTIYQVYQINFHPPNPH